MKIGIIFIMLLCIGCSGTQQYSFSIRGNVEGAKYGKAFLLTPKEEVICSTKIDGGDFELRGTLEEPGQYVLRVNRQQFMFFMDGKKMRIECPYRSFSSKYLKGAPANDLSIEYGKLQEDYTAKQERFLKEYKKAMDAGEQKARQYLFGLHFGESGERELHEGKRVVRVADSPGTTIFMGTSVETAS